MDQQLSSNDKGKSTMNSTQQRCSLQINGKVCCLFICLFVR